MKGKKAIVFTESTETAQYLYEELKEIYGERIIYFSGQSSAALKVEIEDSFNPKFKDKNNDKYDLLITTDVLQKVSTCIVRMFLWIMIFPGILLALCSV